MPLPKGLICPILLPIKKSGKLDRIKFTSIWNYIMPWVSGISIGSSILEMEINFEEKKEVFKLVSNIWDKKTPIFLDITCENEYLTLELARFVAEIFSREKYAFLEVFPLLYRGNRGLPQHLEGIYKITQMPIILVNHPKMVSREKMLFKHKNIRTAIFKRICKEGYVYAMIFQGKLNRFFNYQRALHGREFLFYEGDEATFLKQPTTAGVVAITSNLAPNWWQKAVSNMLNLKKTEHMDTHTLLVYGQRLRALHEICASRPSLIYWGLRELGVLDGLEEVPRDIPTNFKKMIEEIGR